MRYIKEGIADTQMGISQSLSREDNPLPLLRALLPGEQKRILSIRESTPNENIGITCGLKVFTL